MPVHAKLADADLRRALAAMVRRRVPPHEVDEIVQATLADAVASKSAPTEDEALERWVRGIARHKVADYHRRNKREVPVESDDLMTARVTDASAHDAADLLRWAEREANSDNEGTIDWLLREGDGEKLESIAQEANVPAARVRQRVSRLRRHFRARWAAQIAAALALGALVVYLLRGREPKPIPIAPVTSAASASVSAPPPPPPPPNPAIELRRLALEQCASKQWQACLDRLDEAAKLDPAGDSSAEVQGARKAANDALTPPPPPKITEPKPKAPTKYAPKKPAKEDFPNTAF
jgi:DNA-directed RNA polymerase specialized sigma24 family protein